MRNVIAKYYRVVSRYFLRKRLRNRDFTLLTNTCIGGIIYHELGLQFLSPTINLWMHDKDFYKFANKLEYYLSLSLRFVESEENYPVAYLGDIPIHFNHYKTAEEAESKWNERKARIKYDNIFIICSDRPVDNQMVTREDMLSLKNVPCRGRVVFSTRTYDDIDYIVPLPKDPDGDYVNSYMFDKSNLLKRWRWESAWDWVYWLNTGKVKVKK